MGEILQREIVLGRHPKISNAFLCRDEQIIRYGYSVALEDLTAKFGKLPIGASRFSIADAVKRAMPEVMGVIEFLAILQAAPTTPEDRSQLVREAVLSKYQVRVIARHSVNCNPLTIRRSKRKRRLKNLIIEELEQALQVGETAERRRTIIERLINVDNIELGLRIDVDNVEPETRDEETLRREQMVVTAEIERARRQVLVEALGVEMTNFRMVFKFLVDRRYAPFIASSDWHDPEVVQACAIEMIVAGDKVPGMRFCRL